MSSSLTLSLPSDLAAAIEGAVARGAFSSPEALVKQALVEWQSRDADLQQALNQGFADLEAGRVAPFDLERILAEGAG